MKLSDWAKEQGVSYLTAWRWFKQGILPVKSVQLATGTILVEPSEKKVDKVVVYSRVSSYEKKADLDRQAQRCVEFCARSGWTVEKVVKEVASGMNDKRPKLLKMLDQMPSAIVVEHKDRLTRFGFNYFDCLLPKLGCKLIVINRDAEEKDDLVKDLIAIVTSFCCRLYGLRRGRDKAAKAKVVICEEPAN